MKSSLESSRIIRIAWALFAAMFVIYNANGREISSYDSQPTKFAAVELVLNHTLTMDWLVRAVPDYAARPAFQRDRDGHYRSAYSIVPSLEAAAVAWVAHVTHLVDLRAPLGPAVIAVLTASLLTAAAVALVFVALARTATTRTALLVAIGLGLGTNLWPLASRTLWQLETVSAGLALALYGWLRPNRELTPSAVTIGAVGLTLAGAARVQIAPVVVVLLAGLVVRVGFRKATPAVGVVVISAAVLMTLQWHWFGHLLGAAEALQEQNLKAHGVTSTVSDAPWLGALGLLVSPSRGLLIFSPILLLAIGALPATWRTQNAGERWWTTAAVAQFVAYSCYSMWWGGHTFGPRYLVDLLIPLTPAAAVGTAWALQRRWTSAIAGALLVTSIAIAATGAFCYPNDQWNTDPDVDTNHDRLWDWHDTQISRCWQRGPATQNFSLFQKGGF